LRISFAGLASLRVILNSPRSFHFLTFLFCLALRMIGPPWTAAATN
jgi:hypothetical protein